MMPARRVGLEETRHWVFGNYLVCGQMRKVEGRKAVLQQRAEAVEAGGVVRGLGVAERGHTVGEGIGSYCEPDGIFQVRGRFHNDGEVAISRDEEAELIGLYPEILWLRIP